jgi:hypothetical protein
MKEGDAVGTEIEHTDRDLPIHPEMLWERKYVTDISRKSWWEALLKAVHSEAYRACNGDTHHSRRGRMWPSRQSTREALSWLARSRLVFGRYSVRISDGIPIILIDVL